MANVNNDPLALLAGILTAASASEHGDEIRHAIESVPRAVSERDIGARTDYLKYLRADRFGVLLLQVIAGQPSPPRSIGRRLAIRLLLTQFSLSYWLAAMLLPAVSVFLIFVGTTAANITVLVAIFGLLGLLASVIPVGIFLEPGINTLRGLRNGAIRAAVVQDSRAAFHRSREYMTTQGKFASAEGTLKLADGSSLPFKTTLAWAWLLDRGTPIFCLWIGGEKPLAVPLAIAIDGMPGR